jgi:hypothetical protein
MDVIAHGLWAAAAAIGKRNLAGKRLPVGWMTWWAMFPDVFAFGPSVAMALWLRLAGGPDYGPAVHRGHLPHVGLGLPLYPAGHSLVIFALVFGLVAVVARRPVLGLLGWLLHILMDIPTHSLEFYATRFLWPIAGWRIDGISWRTPWFLLCTYIALVLVYFLLWRSGRLTQALSRERRACPAATPGATS